MKKFQQRDYMKSISIDKEKISTPKIKILLACHMPCAILNGDVFVPIHVGRELAKSQNKDGLLQEESLNWLKANTIGDNEGDNISTQNRCLCELTALYWAWKNYDTLGNPDYIGLMHYRRHLCFNLDNTDKPNNKGLVYGQRIDDEYIRKFGLDSESVTSIVGQHDIIVGEKCDLEKLGTKTCYNHYASCDPAVLHVKDYDIVLRILIEKHPEYKKASETYNSSKYAYFANLFIMKKALFMEYMEWLFPIIFEAQQRIDISQYNVSEARVLSYCSEWLFGIWYTHLKNTREVSALELKRTFVINPSPMTDDIVAPISDDNNIAICFATDEIYLPYLAVAIQSIIEHSNPHNKYDINILHENLSPSQQRSITSMRGNNIFIRFVSVKRFHDRFSKLFYTRVHFSNTVYSRFFIQEVLNKYTKILYLDCDLVVNKDVAELYNTPLNENKLMGVIRDYEVMRKANKQKGWACSYINKTLGIARVTDYFQSGVLLINVKQFQREDILNELISTLTRLKTPNFVDQDILNAVCKGRVLYLDPRWNVEYHIPFYNPDWAQTMPAERVYEYMECRSDPWILHFSSDKKPWHDPSLEMSEHFWKYARHTTFYEEILYRSRQSLLPNNQALDESFKELKYKIKEIGLLPDFRRKLKRINFKICVSWGGRKKRYLNRKKQLEKRIKAVEEFLKMI